MLDDKNEKLLRHIYLRIFHAKITVIDQSQSIVIGHENLFVRINNKKIFGFL